MTFDARSAVVACDGGCDRNVSIFRRCGSPHAWAIPPMMRPPTWEARPALTRSGPPRYDTGAIHHFCPECSGRQLTLKL